MSNPFDLSDLSGTFGTFDTSGTARPLRERSYAVLPPIEVPQGSELEQSNTPITQPPTPRSDIEGAEPKSRKKRKTSRKKRKRKTLRKKRKTNRRKKKSTRSRRRSKRSRK